jgi:hypothetical protein
MSRADNLFVGDLEGLVPSPKKDNVQEEVKQPTSTGESAAAATVSVAAPASTTSSEHLPAPSVSASAPSPSAIATASAPSSISEHLPASSATASASEQLPAPIPGGNENVSANIPKTVYAPRNRIEEEIEKIKIAIAPKINEFLAGDHHQYILGAYNLSKEPWYLHAVHYYREFGVTFYRERLSNGLTQIILMKK